MKPFARTCLLSIAIVSWSTVEAVPAEPRSGSLVAASVETLAAGQPKLLRIRATVDGTGRVIFTRSGVRYEHKHWSPPTDVEFDGEPWNRLSQTPAAWRDVADRLDLTKAWIVKRKGRDVIALESTPDGFDLFLCDSPNEAAEYEVVIAIPRRN